MNTTDFTPLAPRPSLEQYKKQAKDFVKLAKAGNTDALQQITKWHPRSAQLLDSAIPDAQFVLADAQLTIARKHGFESWAKFAKAVAELNRVDSPVSKFEMAAEAVVTGDDGKLESLLQENPELVPARSMRLHRATLLHYIGANGFEDFRQRTPENALEVAQILLNAGAEVDAVANIYGGSTTLGLVATSIHPKQAGVQIELMKMLLDYGAAIDGASGLRTLIAALHNGRPEAAEFLAQRGAQLDLEGAAGVGWLDAVENFFNEDGNLKANATKAQMEAGFLWACEYGRNGVVAFLLRKGMDLRTGEGTGMTALHWAVIGGQLETIGLLLESGAPLEAKNVYGGTALGQALWSASHGDAGIDYVSIIEMLIHAGAKIEEGSLAWLEEQKGRSRKPACGSEELNPLSRFP
ncbi:MAG: ankyrin repeat domain-containing protein [Acidobacteriota bacterium]|nr:ankyrin repeat domain-containing protein [Acidobacteriota bacterium]